MLKEKVSAEIVSAMKSQDTLKKGVLQLVKAQIVNLEIKEKRELTSDEENAIIQREVKQNKEALAEAEKYSREDLAAETKRKIEILVAYLPKQLDANEVKEVILAAGVTKGMNMGEAMKLAMPNLKGKTENALISKTVKEIIS